jgi:hypothetical protein
MIPWRAERAKQDRRDVERVSVRPQSCRVSRCGDPGTAPLPGDLGRGPLATALARANSGQI